MISYGRQTIDEDDIKEVVKVLSSNWLTQGPTVNKFESKLNEFFNSDYCVAVANGTAALHLVATALGWSKDDVIITSPITFLASANCIEYVNAQKVIFCYALIFQNQYIKGTNDKSDQYYP